MKSEKTSEEKGDCLTETSYIKMTPDLRNIFEAVTAVHDEAILFLRKEYDEQLEAYKEEVKKWEETIKSLPEGEKQPFKPKPKFKFSSVFTLGRIMRRSETYKDGKDRRNVYAHILEYGFTQAYREFKAFSEAHRKYIWLSPKERRKQFKAEPRVPSTLADRGRYAAIHFEDFPRGRGKNAPKKQNQFYIPKTKIVFSHSKGLNPEDFKCVNMKYIHGVVKVGLVYGKQPAPMIGGDKWLGIDVGLRSFLTAVCNDEDISFLVSGGPFKEVNQFFNKINAKYRSSLEKRNHTKKSKRLDNLVLKYERKLDAMFHVLSKRIIEFCAERSIGNIAVGWNKGIKQGGKKKVKEERAKSKTGKVWRRGHDGKSRVLGNKAVERFNQKFVGIPYYKFIHMLEYKGKMAGINVVVTEESHTSKVDHLALEELCHHAKGKYLGQRKPEVADSKKPVGLFKSSVDGKILNADCNGAIGMMRKVGGITDEQLISMRSRKDIASPRVVKLHRLETRDEVRDLLGIVETPQRVQSHS